MIFRSNLAAPCLAFVLIAGPAQSAGAAPARFLDVSGARTLVANAGHNNERPRSSPRRRRAALAVRAPYTDVDAGPNVHVDAPYARVRIDPYKVRVRTPYVDLIVPRW